jgi:hypothetical protein
MGRQKKKKKKKQGGNTAMTNTTSSKTYGGNYTTTWWSTHIHGKWVKVGGYQVWLKSQSGSMNPHVDVYIDLAGLGLQRSIPPELTHLIPNPKPLRIVWEIDDGRVDSDLPNHVVTLLKAGYSLGWGCLGGHGRTGWLAAKVHQILTGCTGREAVKHIQDNYCPDAIESVVQFANLGTTMFAQYADGDEGDDPYRWDQSGTESEKGALGPQAEDEYEKHVAEWNKDYGKDIGRTATSAITGAKWRKDPVNGMWKLVVEHSESYNMKELLKEGENK